MPTSTERRDGYTTETEGRLLRRLAAGKSIAAACRYAGIVRQTYYNWREAYPEFARLADDAIEDGTDAIEDNALDQAKHGAQTLMVLMLKARRPEKYRDRSDVNLGGKDGAPLTIVLGERPDGPS